MPAMGYPDHAPWLRRWRAEAHAGRRGLAKTPGEWLVHRHRSQWFDQTRACPRAGSVASGAKRRQPDSPLHPLVAVAEGSHANYLHATDERSPEWSGCGAHVSPQTVAAP